MKKDQRNEVPVVGIGASAGGLQALKTFCKYMPSNTGLAIVIVQHLDPDHDSMLTELLSSHTSMEVVEVKNKMELRPNTIFIIPPKHNLTIKDNHLFITSFTDHHNNRSAIDDFFYSLAEEKEGKAIAIVLSGTGEDGSQGVKRVKEKGGIILVQDPELAEYKRMPESAIQTGAVDFVVDIKLMPEKIIDYVTHAFAFEKQRKDGANNNELFFKEIIDILQIKTKNSFHYYRRKTLLRRIERRMGITRVNNLNEYVSLLKENPKEVQTLFKDLLIGVTGFFREPEVWEKMQKEVIKPKLQSMKNGSTLRIWVPGCASGQEAYSIAILTIEAIAEMDKILDFQIFATDIDNRALEIARTGVYSAAIAAEVDEERLVMFFTEKNGQFSVNNKLRDHIVFSHQNLIGDPPFSRIDIISCRNLLIYLEPSIQNQVISLFHFSLLPDGMLLLGNSESLGEHHNLFHPIDKQLRIFKKNILHKRAGVTFPIVQSSSSNLWEDLGGKQNFKRKESLPQEMTKEFLLQHYSPPSILINANNEILYINGAVEKYLRIAPGEPSNNLLLLLREGLTTRVHGAITKARNAWEKVLIDRVRVKRDEELSHVRIEISPVTSKEPAENALLIAFFEHQELDLSADPAEYASDEKIINELEYELQATKEDQRSIIEELESSNDELKAANEEIMTMNEELQSSNEELKTSQEKLQSLNEELHTLNTQLGDNIRELERSNDDLNNLIQNTEPATVFVNREGRINSYTPAAKKIFNLLAQDKGRKISDLSDNLDNFDLSKVIEHVNATTEHFSEVIKSSRQDYYFCTVRPYRTSENKLEGVVITFNDITNLKNHQLALEATTKILKLTQGIAKIGSWESDLRTNEVKVSENMVEILELDSVANFVDMERFRENYIHPDDWGKYQKWWDALLKGEMATIEYRMISAEENIKNIRSAGFITNDENQNPVYLTGYIQDVTDQKEYEGKLEELNIQLRELNVLKDQMFAIISHDLRSPLHNMRSYLTILKTKYDSLDKQKVIHMIDMFSESLSSSISILENLLHWAQHQITDGESEKKEITGREISKLINDEIKVLSNDKNIMFDLNIFPDASVYADFGQFTIILRNLISNSMKFTPEGGKIKIVSILKGSKTVITIKDNGVGIEEANLKNLFDPARREKRKGTNNEKGFGLGLIFVKEFVTSSKGKIDVASKVGKGTTFTIELPCSGK